VNSLLRLLDGDDVPLRAQTRDLDAVYAALEATATPLRSTTFDRDSAQLTEIASITAATRNYAAHSPRKPRPARSPAPRYDRGPISFTNGPPRSRTHRNRLARNLRPLSVADRTRFANPSAR
jgi:hypothetical protein